MRIRIIQSGVLSPCGNTPQGEVEDYTVNVINWFTIEPTSNTLAPSDSVITDLIADGTQMTAGNYQYYLRFSSNDLNKPMDTVLYNIVVFGLSANATASPNEICSGNSSQLDVEVEGGSGSYSYLWTSEPGGYTSTDKNPVFSNITENTTFFYRSQ